MRRRLEGQRRLFCPRPGCPVRRQRRNWAAVLPAVAGGEEKIEQSWKRLDVLARDRPDSAPRRSTVFRLAMTCTMIPLLPSFATAHLDAPELLRPGTNVKAPGFGRTGRTVGFIADDVVFEESLRPLVRR
jgi:hypothetical protein